MPAPRPTTPRVTPFTTGTPLTEWNNRAPVPPPGNRRPARSLAAPARPVPPRARPLPRRAGY
ncbi:hypothetical protein GCM10018785_66750 [Streptomyces longispororuber]|uniref:Uncharacterized protein n=1 Tax=Streptomyces longispororuber TaxID=68230 RepID=A0A919DW52_9ACTN|nr:hypothetical protein [Streptomyces longispororuber]GHE90618.1 hypothetical protein GCM10018785_66750 [Streptomyces longispororuber]